jgi:hypothetical protein
MKLPKILNAILCEDIRMEITGKFSLAGVFGSDMAVLQLQGPFPCGVFAEMLPEELGQYNCDFRVIDASSKELIRGMIPINTMSTERQPLVLGPFNLVVSKHGEVKFQWRIGEGRWVSIKTFNVLPPPDIQKMSFPDTLKTEIAKRIADAPQS